MLTEIYATTANVNRGEDDSYSARDFSQNDETDSSTLTDRLVNINSRYLVGLIFRNHGIPAGVEIMKAALVGHISTFPASSSLNIGDINVLALDSWSGEKWAPESFMGWDYAAAARFAITLRDTSSNIIDSVTEHNRQWELREGDVSGEVVNEFLAYPIVVPAGNPVLGSAELYLHNPGGITSGNVWLTVHPMTIKNSLDTSGILGYDADLSTVLATSDTVPVSAIVNVGGLNTFNFSGLNQITLPTGSFYAIVLQGDFTAHPFNNIQWGYEGNFSRPSGARSYGASLGGFDGANFHTPYDLELVFGGTNPDDVTIIPGSTPITWVAESATTGLHEAPDISTLIQAAVDQPTYADGDPIALSIIPTIADSGKYFSSANQGINPAFSLFVIYRLGLSALPKGTVFRPSAPKRRFHVENSARMFKVDSPGRRFTVESDRRAFKMMSSARRFKA